MLDRASEHADPAYPLFFKDPKGQSALDSALEMNQLQSVNLMVNYILKCQNSPVFAHLFSRNLVAMLEKGVACTGLFRSKILNMKIDFFEWPSLSRNTLKAYRPFNGSIFKFRYEYNELFPKISMRDDEYNQQILKREEELRVPSDLNYSQDEGLASENKKKAVGPHFTKGKQ
mmetsp:Transcript_7369/g.11550  ORF Transcript_7369/g.11550 Transcript_7369/m.11550 type:complete len:173 (-) Transcript_7369:89-607(-)